MIFLKYKNVTVSKNIIDSEQKISDLKNIPQNSTALNSKSSNYAKKDFKDYYTKYFRPWNSDVIFDVKALENIFSAKNRQKKLYTASYSLFNENDWSILKENANLYELESLNYRAIILRNTNLKIYAINSPLFKNRSDAGEVFPFDYSQDDYLKIGEPVLISHYTKDGDFAYVLSSSNAQGFVLSEDLVPVDSNFIKKFKENLVMLKADIKAKLGNYSTTNLKMGTILPLNEKSSTLSIPIRLSADNSSEVGLLELKINQNDLIKKPLVFSEDNISKITDELINKPYGWGGNNLFRDCAKLVRDYFAVFGIHMPLSSKQQAMQGDVISLKDLNSEEKIKLIKEKAIAYQSIIYTPGHVVLYMGTFNEEPLVFQAVWGFKVFSPSLVEYRFVNGKSILSTLSPAESLEGYSNKFSFIAASTKIINVVN